MKYNFLFLHKYQFFNSHHREQFSIHKIYLWVEMTLGDKIFDQKMR